MRYRICPIVMWLGSLMWAAQLPLRREKGQADLGTTHGVVPAGDGIGRRPAHRVDVVQIVFGRVTVDSQEPRAFTNSARSGYHMKMWLPAPDRKHEADHEPVRKVDGPPEDPRRVRAPPKCPSKGRARHRAVRSPGRKESSPRRPGWDRLGLAVGSRPGLLGQLGRLVTVGVPLCQAPTPRAQRHRVRGVPNGEGQKANIGAYRGPPQWCRARARLQLTHPRWSDSETRPRVRAAAYRLATGTHSPRSRGCDLHRELVGYWADVFTGGAPFTRSNSFGSLSFRQR